MTKGEAKDMRDMLLSVRRYVDEQTISYEKKQAQDTLYKLIHACHEVLAGEPQDKVHQQYLAG